MQNLRVFSILITRINKGIQNITHNTTQIPHYTTQVIHNTTQTIHYTTQVAYNTTHLLNCNSKLVDVQQTFAAQFDMNEWKKIMNSVN